MVEISRVRVAFTNFIGAPGVATYYSLDSVTIVDSLSSMWGAFAGWMPSGVQIHVENSGDVLESTNGVITGAWSQTAAPDRVGATGGPYSAASGACITWDTETVADRRRLRGRSFVVPLGGSCFTAGGGINDATLATLRNASHDFFVSQDTSFVVWHRPVEARAADATHPERVERAGAVGLVTSSRVNPRGAVLRSRRD